MMTRLNKETARDDKGKPLFTSAMRRQRLRDAAADFLALMKPWCEGRQCEVIARAAVRALVDTLDKER